MFQISGKVALITGGAAGIGFATARELLANAAKGVAIIDINQQAGEKALKELRKLFGKERSIFIHKDVASKLEVEDAFKRTLDEFKNIDILVNNAGIENDEDYEREIAVNFTGTVHGTLLALENYIANHKSGTEGVIINNASEAGTLVIPCLPVYCATKTAVVNMSMTLGHKVYHDRTKIKVLAIAPGHTDTNIRNEVKYRNEFDEVNGENLTKNAVLQSSEFVAKQMVKIIAEKPSGTVWIVNDNKEAYEYIPPSSGNIWF
ncbi:hypothetical protein HHI36_004972 [Cryptolaemus montrouzieri]|uniref:15-hydroxyprostaglandin dehydrogenase [NAD(+)]-like n=1 Tax=Cryptolaemus montrouzieri TaxID=559131 RepID=A0ABD2NTQ4_9CUCU